MEARGVRCPGCHVSCFARGWSAIWSELADHIDRQVADLIARGVGPAEAARRVRLEFGGREPIKEIARHVRGTRWVEDGIRDV